MSSTEYSHSTCQYTEFYANLSYTIIIIIIQVVKALHETEETNARLHAYIDGLLANIIEHHPELLERR